MRWCPIIEAGRSCDEEAFSSAEVDGVRLPLCVKHYWRVRRHGDPLYRKPRVVPTSPPPSRKGHRRAGQRWHGSLSMPAEEGSMVELHAVRAGMSVRGWLRQAAREKLLRDAAPVDP